MLLAGQRLHVQPADTHLCQHGRAVRPLVPAGALAQDGREARLLFLGVRDLPDRALTDDAAEGGGIVAGLLPALKAVAGIQFKGGVAGLPDEVHLVAPLQVLHS